MSKKSFSLLEILISMTILAMVVAGMANLFVGSKRWFVHSRSRMTGGELGKLFLDPLQMDVTQGERSTGAENGWGQVKNCLSQDGTNPAGCDITPRSSGGVSYTPQYTNSQVGGSNLRRVVLTIGWSEPSY